VLIALSTSGNSANCVNAALVAKAMGLNVIAMTGDNGGKLRELADAVIAVPEIEKYKIPYFRTGCRHEIDIMSFSC